MKGFGHMLYVSYLRVSTTQQGIAGLGIAAQKETVANYLRQCGGEHIAELVEVESGRNNLRPQLANALALCRRRRAVLLIAKLDRLGRSVSFISSLQDAGVKFVACDCPEANEMMIGMLAVFAQYEAKMISARTKAALAAAKAKGVKLGRKTEHSELVQMSVKGTAAAASARIAKSASRAANMLPVVAEIRQAAEGKLSLRQMADALNARGETTPNGKQWSAVQVMRLLAHEGVAA